MFFKRIFLLALIKMSSYTISDAATLRNIDDQMYMLLMNIENITFYILSFFLCCVIMILYFIPKKQWKRYFTLFIFGCFFAQRAIVFIHTDNTAQSKTLSLKHEVLFSRNMNELKSSVSEMHQLVKMSIHSLQNITVSVSESIETERLRYQDQFQKKEGVEILELVSQNKNLVDNINSTTERLFERVQYLLAQRSRLLRSPKQKRNRQLEIAKMNEISVVIDNLYPEDGVTVYTSKRQQYVKLIEKKDLHALSRGLTLLGSMIDIASSTNSEIMDRMKELPKNYSPRNKVRMFIEQSVRQVQMKNSPLELEFLQVIKPYLLKVSSYSSISKAMLPFISSDISVTNLKYLTSILLPKFDVDRFDLNYEVSVDNNFNVPIMSTLLVYLCTYNPATMALLVGSQTMWFIKHKFSNTLYEKPTIQQLTPQKYMKQKQALEKITSS